MSKPQLGIRDVEPEDALAINRYWAAAAPEDLERLGELGRPDEEETVRFIASLCATRPPPDRAEEGLLLWLLDGGAVGYSTLKDIAFGREAQIHLHMWDKGSRGKGFGAVFFCLCALEFIERFRLKALYCQPKLDNPAPNRMLRRLGFSELGPVDYRRSDGSVIRQSRFLIGAATARRHLSLAEERFLLRRRGRSRQDPRSPSY